MNSPSRNPKTRVFAGLLTAFLFIGELPAADFVVLETEPGGKTRVVAGEASAAEKEVTPASTFKIVIAWAGLAMAVIPRLRRCPNLPDS